LDWFPPVTNQKGVVSLNIVANPTVCDTVFAGVVIVVDVARTDLFLVSVIVEFHRARLYAARLLLVSVLVLTDRGAVVRVVMERFPLLPLFPTRLYLVVLRFLVPHEGIERFRFEVMLFDGVRP